MLRYLKAAFWIRERIPLLGEVPVNALAMSGLFTLGFGHPAFWLLGLLGETAYLWAMSSHPRFRNIVDALGVQSANAIGDQQQIVVVEQLNAEHRSRHEHLKRQLAEIQHGYDSFAPDDFTARSNLSSLRALDAAYAKLLLARQHLTETNHRTRVADIESEIQALHIELQGTDLSPTTRASKEATLELLEKRLDASKQRSETLTEIESDLKRIEAQFSLAADSTAIRAKPEDLHLDVDLTSRLISTSEVTPRRLLE